METIAAVMLEPVGCLAEFRAEEFDKAAHELFGSTTEPAASGSEAYWRLVGLFDPGNDAVLARLEALELAAVEQADLYEDVRPSLAWLRAAGVNVHLVSSLSRRAVARFIERFALADLLDGSVAREDAAGVGALPLRYAIDQSALDPARCIYLVDTPQSLAMAKQLGVNAILMINDYDEGRALAEQSPSGGVVSLAELSDALQLIEQRSGLRSVGRMPLKPFELFEPG